MSKLESFNLFIHCRDVLCVLVAQSCPTLRDLMDCGSVPARLLCPLNSPGKNTGVGCHFLPLGNFPTQGSNPGLLHFRWILYYLSRQESPRDVLVSWGDPPANAGDSEKQFNLWVRKILWRRKWQPTAVFLPGKLHGQRNLVGCSPLARKE